MEAMRELLRTHLRRSLQGMSETDRLAAAWPVACGAAMAAHGRVTGYADSMVLVEVFDSQWMQQMLAMQNQIASEMGRIAGVRVTGVHFERKFPRG